MRLAGALLSCLAVVSLAAAEPAKQAAPKQDAAAKQAPAKPKKAAAPKADKKAALDAIAASYNAIPLADRLAIQNDLIWTGDYNGAVNGEFGERAIAAVKAFQKRTGAKETGVLNQPERAALASAARPKQDAVGWRMIDDAATGARVGVPGKLVPQASQVAGGTRWASSRGEYSVETFRVAQAGTTLPAVFERMKKEPAGRKADYSVLRPDFFVISGLQNLKKFYVRAQLRGEEVRGFTVLYDQAMAGIMDPVVVAMSSAYAAFPAGRAAPPPRRKVEYASGVVVSPAGDIVVNRDTLDGCFVVTVAGIGGADRIAEDKASGLALLRVHGANLKPVALGENVKAADVTLVGVPDPQAQGGGSVVSTAKARLSDAFALDSAPALGFDGAAALDAQGRLVGIAALRPAVVAGPAPAGGANATVTPVETIRNFLGAQNVAPVSAAGGLEAAKASVVRIICVRK
jgi:peptidoglycan hydrolase-like protein with peptidoglycan-binding domain